MKPSLALFAEPTLAIARRWLWLSIWLLWAPMGIYMTWLRRGHTLVSLHVLLLAVALFGLVVINSETAAVLWQHGRGLPSHQRGFLQRWLGRPWSVAPERPHLLTQLQPQTTLDLPMVSVVVVAYLPNEQDIIEDTLLHWLTQVEIPAAGWEVILAYNTPTWLPVEARLQQLAQQYPDLVLLPVYHSRSKAENLNAALSQVRGEMTCIFDADHHPAPQCLRLAWAWLAQGQYDGVQGRNIIRNAGDNWLTHLIAVEFECVYGVSHYGRSLMADTALFGGSNGYWRTEQIRDLGFNPSRLTEDIDATVRGMLKGYRLVHDPAIIITELAPDSLRGLWLQRQRWSQGWLEVAESYLKRVAKSPYLDPIQKGHWLVLLLLSQCFYPLVWQVVPMMLSVYLSSADRDLTFENLNMTVAGLLTLSVLFQVALAIRLRPPQATYSHRHGWLYCLLSPLYFWLKVTIAMVALYNHLCGSRVWHVTARTQCPALSLGLREANKPYPVKSR